MTEAELQAYVDGRLSESRQAVVASWLAAHPEEAARIETYRQQRDALRLALAPVVEEPLPPELDLHLRRHRRLGRWSARGMAVAASIALALVVGGGSGWMLRGLSAPTTAGTAALAREAAASYAVYANDADRPVEIAGSDQQMLDDWFSRRLSRPIKAPDLGPAGFRLIGGRLVATDFGPAGLYLYRDASGNRVALYVRPMRAQGNDRMTKRDVGLVRGWTWADDGLGFGMFGEMTDEQLHRTADMARAQFTSI
ncbi:MAG: anti-sigma factor [Alphaproteobacteria bacterium]|nr:anti-sigma factor [Alphaproteobacteria bacterium]MBU0794814.1 anti-sigma factor [Alphaproteobacteria bacterium]MBU1768720.1 anti-sigma factor [Alphaproteobacteria bacterium]